jgi:hypothetical protein
VSDLLVPARCARVPAHDPSPRWRVAAQVVKVCAHDALGRAFEALAAKAQVGGLRLDTRWLAGLCVDPQVLLVGQLQRLSRSS